MKPEIMRYISVKEKTHFMKCPDCGGYFDMRDLQQVSDHFHKSAALKAEYPHAERIGGPKFYTKRKRRKNLNSTILSIMPIKVEVHKFDV